MANKAVFMDRDKTIIEDPGYLSDPSAVKLLPGVELAIKSLAQAGFKVVVVTNQTGVARGLLSEDDLQAIHGELRRQLGEKGAHLDAIYYCPYHPEGTVEAYAKESDLRKPKPGMLLKAAGELEIDLASSWMVGDSARDIEAGQRAGCRTVRVRTPQSQTHVGGTDEDENVQADFTVRNLVDAARVILRESGRHVEGRPAGARRQPATRPAEQPAPPTAGGPAETMDDSRVRQEILRCVRQFVAERHSNEFSYTKFLAGVIQMLAVMMLVLTIIRMVQGEIPAATVWGIVSMVLQTMSLTLFLMQRNR